MKYLIPNSIVFAFVFLIGSLLLVQCDRDNTDRDDMGINQEETARDQTQSTYSSTETPRGERGFEQEREELMSDLEELRDSIGVVLNNRRSTAGEGSGEFEQLQNDIEELEQEITNLRDATEENWDQTRRETEQVYERIRTDNAEGTNTPANNPNDS